MNDTKSPLSQSLVKAIWNEVLNLLGRAWWIEISTTLPNVTYYFGPFITSQEAELSIERYMASLQDKSSQSIRSTVKRCKPGELVVNGEMAEVFDSNSLVSSM
jgi:Domain of unknown function (DUF1816)